MNTEKSLNLGKKVIYGFGDLGGNFLAIFIGAFIMIYLTNTIGLNAGIIGTLMLVARIFDGVTDVIFGSIMDHTHTKFGKARPWMLGSAFLCAIGIAAIYAMPEGIGATAQYAYFFIVYVLTNAFFYTANNISYSALSALITKNSEERVQLGTARYVCSTIAMMVILSVSVPLVTYFGGGTAGWRTVALIYAAVFLILNLICVLGLKELPEDDYETKDGKREGDVSMLGVFSTAQNICCMIGLMATPVFVKKFGMYKAVTTLTAVGILPALLFAGAAYSSRFAVLIPATALLGLFMGPIMGTLSATVADIGTYLNLTKKVHVEGSLFSCSSIGIKVGSGVGGAMVGWILELPGFDGMAAVQPDSAIFAMRVTFAVMPVLVFIVVCLCFKGLNMKAAIENAKAEK